MTEAGKPGFKVGMPRARSVAAPRWAEQAGDLGYVKPGVAGLDVAHDGARGLVQLVHDHGGSGRSWGSGAYFWMMAAG